MEILRECAIRVVKMVGRVCKAVDFQVAKGVRGELSKKPVHDHSAFDAALAMQDENNLFVSASQEGIFDHGISGSDILCGVVETSLDETLNYVKNEAVTDALVSWVAWRRDGVDKYVGLLTLVILLPNVCDSRSRLLWSQWWLHEFFRQILNSQLHWQTTYPTPIPLIKIQRSFFSSSDSSIGNLECRIGRNPFR